MRRRTGRPALLALIALAGVHPRASAEASGPRRNEGRPVAPIVASLPDPGLPPGPAASAPAPFCQTEYADDLSRLGPSAREAEKQPYSFCVRNTATYECVSYGADGNLKRARKTAVLHGTAFAYRQQGGETLLLTNHHVAEWPAVTDAEHTVDGVGAGCKRVSEAIRIVDEERDDYGRDDIPLARVASDPQLDAAVLKARSLLPVLPWKIGHSAALRERNVVEVRGFPLGAFRATNVGKVVSAYDHDDYKEWDHDDFVIDALLSEGNSGSPVLAVSCRTGELQLVGLFHAGYSHGSALNVVVGIDQLRDLMTTLKRSPRPHSEPAVTLDGEARGRLVREAAVAIEPFFGFGLLPAAVRMRADSALIFELFSRDFPGRPDPIFAFEDLPAASGFGEVGALWFGGGPGFKRYLRADLDPDAQAQVARLVDALRRDAVASFAFRAEAGRARASRLESQRYSRMQRAIARTAASRSDLAQATVDLAEHLAPQDGENGHPLADLFAPAPPFAPPPGGASVEGSATVAATASEAAPSGALTAPSAPSPARDPAVAPQGLVPGR